VQAFQRSLLLPSSIWRWRQQPLPLLRIMVSVYQSVWHHTRRLFLNAAMRISDLIYGMVVDDKWIGFRGMWSWSVLRYIWNNWAKPWTISQMLIICITAVSLLSNGSCPYTEVRHERSNKLASSFLSFLSKYETVSLCFIVCIISILCTQSRLYCLHGLCTKYLKLMCY
jgi:hypothetical protein